MTGEKELRLGNTRHLVLFLAGLAIFFLLTGTGAAGNSFGKTEGWGKTCTDGKDNDKNGLIDCEDPGCAKNSACDTCICPDVWDPVCGVDGLTYGNDCEAACAGVEVAYLGECGNPAICGGIAGFMCPDNYVCDMTDPACSTADLAGICVPRPNACLQVYDPVCGCDGITYGNDCERLRAGAILAYPGECDCNCPEIYDPVCGVDGQTYSNACEAKCAGVEIAYKGECRQVCGGIGGLQCPPGQICNYKDPTCSIVDLAGTCVTKPDFCLAIYDPVCGCDGQTYSNDCERIRAGAVLAHPGECKSCDDGTPLVCTILPPTCPAGTILAIQNGCYVCTDPVTCEPVLY